VSGLRYLVVEGPIGVGKTTLAKRLAERLEGETVLEQAQANPFLERFYRDPQGAALPTQIAFLLQRVRQAEMLRQADMFATVRVADFLFDKDRVFARLNLDRDEYALYEQIYERLALEVPVPDLVVYLQEPVDELVRRVARRGIPSEQQIARDYLVRLSDAYSRFFHFYDASPLLIVNNAALDAVSRDADLEALLERIMTIRHGRHYFNPGQPSLLDARD
jgi:deoxyadenosine/deoxycytidine kinase